MVNAALRAAALAAIVITALGGTAAQSSSWAANAGSASDNELVAAVQFRHSFGLREDQDFVARSLADHDAFPNTDWGEPLSVPEAADMSHRVDVQQSLRVAIAFASAQPTYSGAYIDQLRGGLPVFLFTDDPSRYINEIERQLPADATFSVATASHSLSELEQQKDAVSDARDKLALEGIDVINVSVNVTANRVEVGVEKDTPAAQGEIVALAPAAIITAQDRPVADTCLMNDCGPGMHGGLQIDRSDGNYCTSGYIGRKGNDPTDLVIVTAGHCIDSASGQHSTTWTHGPASDPIGVEDHSHEGWHAQSWGDVGYISLNPASTPGVANKLLVTGDTGQLVQINDWLDFGQQIEGLAVCRMGAGSWHLHLLGNTYYKARQCGQIHQYDSDSDGITDRNSQSCVPPPSDACVYIRHMKVVDFDSTGGDSGGAVFVPTTSSSTTTTLLGTHVHSQPDSSQYNFGWYTVWDYGKEEFRLEGVDIDLCLNAACTLVPPG